MDAIVEEILGSDEIKTMLRLAIKKQVVETCAELLQDVLNSDTDSGELKLLFSHRILQISDRFFSRSNEHAMETHNIPVTSAPNNTPVPISGASSETNFSKTVPLSSNETQGAYNFVVSMNNTRQISTNDGFNHVMGPHRPIHEDVYMPIADPQRFVLANLPK